MTEMSCLRSTGGVTRIDRVRNKEIGRCALQRSLNERGEAAVLQWFGHNMEAERSVKKIY